MSIGNHPITLKLDQHHTTLVGGRNGSGKSSALLAIVYCLYGKLLNNMKLEQAINSNNKKALLTKITFEKNGETWQVIRGEKPKKFEIYRNEELLDKQANAREQQEFLDMVLGMDFKLFTQLIAINKERYVPFMEMDAADRRKIVEDILNISVFTEMNEILKQDQKSIVREQANVETQAHTLHAKIEGVENLITQLKSSIKNSTNEVESDIERSKDTLNKLTKKYDSLNKTLDDSISKDLQDVSKMLSEYEKIGDDFDSSIRSYKKEISFFDKNDHCPTCEQPISNEFKYEKKTNSEDKIKEIETALQEMMSEVETCSAKHKELQKKKQETDELKKELLSLQTHIRVEKDTLKNLENKLEKLQESSNDKDKLQEQEALLKEYTYKLNELKASLKSFEDVKKNLDLMKNLLRDDGVKSLIVKDYNAVMNRKINMYMNSMGFFINMTIDENFNEKFHSMNKESFSYANLSTGQKTRLNIAITLALLEVASVKNSAVCNLLWLDELLEPLDAEGVKDVMTLFKENLTHKNIVVVSQRYDEFLDMFDHSLRFVLNGGFTETEK